MKHSIGGEFQSLAVRGKKLLTEMVEMVTEKSCSLSE